MESEKDSLLTQNQILTRGMREIETKGQKDLGDFEKAIFEARKLEMDRGERVRGLESENERLVREIGDLGKRSRELGS